MGVRSSPTNTTVYLGDFSCFENMPHRTSILFSVPLHGPGILVESVVLFAHEPPPPSADDYWILTFGVYKPAGMRLEARLVLPLARNPLPTGSPFLRRCSPPVAVGPGELFALKVERTGSPGPMKGLSVTPQFSTLLE